MMGGLYDLVIVGGGSAGLTAARTAVGLGARVALVDRERLGGECLWSGCVPSKSLIAAARAAHTARNLDTYGLRLDGALAPVDLGAVMDRVRDAIAAVYKGESTEAMRRLGIDVALGRAAFRSPRALAVDGRVLRGRAFIVCTGSRPAVPPIPGLDAVDYLTNETLFDLRRLPGHLLVVGGGPIGAEMAQAFRRLGSGVTVIAGGRGLLPREDAEVSRTVEIVFAREGIAVVRGEARGFARDGGDGVRVRYDGVDGPGEARGDRVLVALGRRPNVEGLGLERAGVAYDTERGIRIDPYLRTTAPHILACGDVTGPYRFTHAAGFQAATAVRNALFPRIKGKPRLDPMPWTTFTEPEVARVGQTEDEARRARGDVVVLRAPFAHVDRAQAEHATEGFVKLVVTGRGEILGAHIVGERAGEYIGEVTLAMRKGLGVTDLARTIHVYPTFAMGVQQAALGFYGRTPFYRLMRGPLGPLVRRALA